MAVSSEDVARAHGLDPARLVMEATVPMWNAAVSSRAACVVRCRTTSDVRAAVRIARELRLPLSVFSGGNDWLGRAVRDRGLVIDVSAMTTIEVDAGARTARIGGGVRSDALARETESHGLTPVTGTVGLVRMLGLSLGGGYGPLEGRFGLACDNLVSAELVTADGSVRTVDAEHDPDLLWALRGGGGNFGVVTAAVVRLHRIGPVYSGMVVYPWSQAESVLTRLDPLLTSAPDELSVQTIIASGRDGAPFVAVMPTWSGAPGQGPEATAAASALGEPISSQTGPTAWHALIAGAAESFPAGRHAHLRTRNVASFTPRVVRTLVEAGSSRTSPLSALSIHPFHGAATRVPVTEAAFGERRPHQMIEIVGLWEAGGPSDAAWADRVHASLADDAMPGGYPNLLGPDDVDQVRDAYGAGAGRLLAVKSRIDPDDVFTATPLPVPGR
ncbi:FAD-dependent oxidoreductase [Streptomyces monashensis]|uniref:FAD-binding oxidoreductase n=1 Tax=Streptomyces monashensis TaxID=1678012 RepID=UPI0033DA9C70